MSNDAKILMFAVLGTLAAVLIWHNKLSSFLSAPTGSNIVSGAPTDSTETEGPAYLLYNTPWAYNPAVGSVLPSMTEGQIGQTDAQPTTDNYTCSRCG